MQSEPAQTDDKRSTIPFGLTALPKPAHPTDTYRPHEKRRLLLAKRNLELVREGGNDTRTV